MVYAVQPRVHEQQFVKRCQLCLCLLYAGRSSGPTQFTRAVLGALHCERANVYRHGGALRLYIVSLMDSIALCVSCAECCGCARLCMCNPA